MIRIKRFLTFFVFLGLLASPFLFGEDFRFGAVDADQVEAELVAEVAAKECSEDELYTMMRGAWPYARLSRDDFEAVLRMLSAGFTPRRTPAS